jgi:hypothetical protein
VVSYIGALKDRERQVVDAVDEVLVIDHLHLKLQELRGDINHLGHQLVVGVPCDVLGRVCRVVLRDHVGRALVVQAAELGRLGLAHEAVDLVHGAVIAVGRGDELRCRENLRGGDLEA